MRQDLSNPQARRRPRQRGAVMVETVIILPFIMVMIVLIVYLGWNFRRVAQVTNMDRYAVWQSTTPGSPGPGTQALNQTVRNPQLNNAFFGLTGDEAQTLAERRAGNTFIPQGHADLRDRQADETFSYFDEFLTNNPRAYGQRFEAEHEHISDLLETMNMSDLTRNGNGHSRMQGDWRYVNGIRFDGTDNTWVPANQRVSPGRSLREVFFADLDDGLEPYADNGNNLARAIREFYTTYPAYRGPDVANDSRNTNLGRNRGGGGAF